MSTYLLIIAGRRRLGMTQAQFADAAQVSRGAVQQWEQATGTAPKRTNQYRVAELLGISVAELMSGRLAADRAVERKVPLVPDINACSDRIADNFDLNHPFRRVPLTAPANRYTYALCVQGDSMVGARGDSFPEGSIIIVEPELDPRIGDYVIAVKPGKKVSFRQLVREGDDLYLKPLNKRYPIELLGRASVVGVVREVSKRFR